MTSNKLKLIAFLVMIFNHLIVTFIPFGNSIFYIGEFIGRISFPIFAFLLAEGFNKTSSIKKYVLRILILWLFSIVPFYLLFESESPFDIKNVFNNVFFTLLMSLFMLILCKKYNNKYQLFIIICFFSSLTIYSDWGVIGPIIVFMMYFSNKNTSKVRTSLIFSVFLILIYYLYSRIYNPLYLITSLGCLMSYYPIKKYNGQLGNSSKLIQYTFYFLYPIHMYVLKIIYDFWIIRQDNMRIFLFLLYN